MGNLMLNVMNKLITILKSSFIDLRFLGLVIVFGIGVLLMDTSRAEIAMPSSTVSTPQFTLEKNGRDFIGLSIHPNSDEWLFSECSVILSPEIACYLLKFNIKTKHLTRYIFPDSYFYSNAHFSPRGNFIVLNRMPKHNGTKEGFEWAVKNSQIVLINADGSNLRVIPTQQGRNLMPIMSLDETKIAYWHQSPLKGERFVGDWAHNDIYEYDLKTGTDQLFAGPFQFMGGKMIQYISEDEILLESVAIASIVQILDEYHKKYNGSQVYKIKRHTDTADFPVPSYTNIEQARNPSVDTNGNVYLQGQYPHGGTTFTKVNSSGPVNYWTKPGNLALTGTREILASPNGSYIAFIYVADGTNYRDRKSTFGQLDTLTSQWLSVDIPPLQTSTPVSVKFIVK